MNKKDFNLKEARKLTLNLGMRPAIFGEILADKLGLIDQEGGDNIKSSIQVDKKIIKMLNEIKYTYDLKNISETINFIIQKWKETL